MADVPDWDDKRNYLINDPLPRRVSQERFARQHSGLGKIDTVEKLAKAAGCVRQTLYTQPRAKILSEIEFFYKIEAGSECAGEFKAGSCQDFVDEYRALHGTLTGVSEPSAASIEPVPLKEDVFADTAKTETPFASLSLRTGQSQNVPGEVSLGFDLNCPEENACGQLTGVKRAFLIFDCGQGRTTDLKGRTGYPVGETFNNAKFTPLSVDVNKPSWRVESTGDCAIGLVGDVPPTFIRVFNLTPGSSVCAELKACVKDIAATFVVPPEGKAQSVAKTKIKKRLREMKIPAGETGEAALALAEIRFRVWEA